MQKKLSAKQIRRIKEKIRCFFPDEKPPEVLRLVDFLDDLPGIVQEVMTKNSLDFLLSDLGSTGKCCFWWFDSICVHLFMGFPQKKATEIVNALLYIYFTQDILSYMEDPIISQRWAIIETFAREFLKCQSIRFIPRPMMLRRRCTRFSIKLALFRTKMAVCFSRTNEKKEMLKVLTLSGWIGFFFRRFQQFVEKDHHVILY
jgi:hypothetical protein